MHAVPNANFQFGIAATINAAETAHIQGVDLFGSEKGRLETTLEFHARFLNGASVPSNVCVITGPTYWLTTRLDTVTTKVHVKDSTTDALLPVDSYQLVQVYSDAGGTVDPVTGTTRLIFAKCPPGVPRCGVRRK